MAKLFKVFFFSFACSSFCFCCSGQLRFSWLFLVHTHTLDKYKSLAIVRTRSAMSSLQPVCRLFQIFDMEWFVEHPPSSKVYITDSFSSLSFHCFLMLVVCCSCKIHFHRACDVCVSCFWNYQKYFSLLGFCFELLLLPNFVFFFSLFCAT